MDSPTTICLRPVSNTFPRTNVISRIESPTGSRPRTETFMPSGESTLGRLTTVSPSGETIGSPLEAVAIPGRRRMIW
jgi:hypothetical protein